MLAEDASQPSTSEPSVTSSGLHIRFQHTTSSSKCSCGTPRPARKTHFPTGISVELDVNAGGPGSILVFVAVDKVVQLLSGQSDDQEPLLSLEGLAELAELVASRL